MKITGSLNVQNHNWNGIKKHVNRHFEDYKNGSKQDTNLAHINQSLSKYNINSEGKIKLSHGHKRFIKNTKNGIVPLAPELIHNLQQSLNQTYSDYIKSHNQSKSVQRHPKRKITDLFKQKLLKKATKRDKKHDPTAQTKLDTYQKTLVQNIGNTDLNQKIIQKMMHQKHWTYKQARNNFLKASSEAGVLFLTQFNKKINTFPHLHLVGYGTNVDETSDKQKRKPDSVHTHFALIGTSFTKLDNNFNPVSATTTTDKNGRVHRHRGAKPSFSFARAVCQDMKVPYRKKTIKIKAHNKNGYRKVNASYHKALSKFRARMGKDQIFCLNCVLKDFYHINLHLTYYQTGQKVNGLSMSEERQRQQIKHIQQVITKHHRQLGAKRSRKLHHFKSQNRKYHQHLRYLKKRTHQIKQKSLAVNSKSDSVNLKSSQVALNQISYSNSASNYAKGASYYYSSSYQSSAQSALEPKLQAVSKASNSISNSLNKLSSMKSDINKSITKRTALDYRLRRQQLIYQKLHKEHQKHLNAQIKAIKNNNHVLSNQDNSIHDKNRQSHDLDTTINHKYETLNELTAQFSLVKHQIKKYEDNFTGFTQNIIKSTKQALHQEADKNVNNVKQLQSANTQHLSSANHQLSSEATKSKVGLFGRIGSFARQIHSNYQSNKASKSASKSYQYSLASTNNSIARPIAQKYNNWSNEVDSLYHKSKFGGTGLYMNENERLNDLVSNPPMTVSQYSEAVKSDTGMTLIESSKSSSASLSKAMPSLKSKSASESHSFSIAESSMAVQRSINNSVVDRKFSESEKADREFNSQQYKSNLNWEKSHPEQAKRRKRERNRGGITRS